MEKGIIFIKRMDKEEIKQAYTKHILKWHTNTPKDRLVIKTCVDF